LIREGGISNEKNLKKEKTQVSKNYLMLQSRCSCGPCGCGCESGNVPVSSALQSYSGSYNQGYTAHA